ncbi:unnamed protein product [Cyprideis torosa]|uniref:Asparagine synthetase [glutamine-hydrolyzing] n=1 Tax=Cyprideis torosa TaxID=163714 RepID=A0A7R8ZXI5_9CRUS|nr:unnamed protein product [Cyprideis torosa]CAG0907179.1 unnamed protein product [Cyprideis torosa]
MCGILGIFNHDGIELDKVKQLSSRQSHRGPDEHDYHQFENGDVIAHERLAIIDLVTGIQPIKGTDKAYVVHNGEIYNHQKLRDNELKHHQFHTTCDSEVIVHLYEEYGYDFCNMLHGVFAFIVSDGTDFIVGRDPIGVKPLYWGKDKNGAMYFSSEMKAIEDQVEILEAFPPGHYFTPKTGFVKYYNPSWLEAENCKEELDLNKLRDALIEATRKRLMSDVPLGVLLSGGLDSSLTSSIAVRLMKEKGQVLHSFSIGLNENAPDLIAAQKVADFLGTKHHNIHFTVEQGIEILDKLVWHLETYDITSIRASTPMYFLSKFITDMGDFLQVAMSLDPKYKMPIKGELMEKDVIRRAFDDPNDPWLPEEILWRQKEQFSDGVGYSWIDELMAYCESKVSDEELKDAKNVYPINTPDTKEAYFMRRLFHKHYPSDSAAKTVKKWIPKWQENKDPSGRANTVHAQTIEK